MSGAMVLEWVKKADQGPFSSPATIAAWSMEIKYR
jgi:hypothetical protein